jgi:hypothetical protein
MSFHESALGKDHPVTQEGDQLNGPQMEKHQLIGSLTACLLQQGQ